MSNEERKRLWLQLMNQDFHIYLVSFASEILVEIEADAVISESKYRIDITNFAGYFGHLSIR
jgi:hypothetical protein